MGQAQTVRMAAFSVLERWSRSVELGAMLFEPVSTIRASTAELLLCAVRKVIRLTNVGRGGYEIAMCVQGPAGFCALGCNFWCVYFPVC